MVRWRRRERCPPPITSPPPASTEEHAQRLGALVDTSLVLLQLSTCATYFIFVGQSLLRAADIVTNCRLAGTLGGATAFAVVCAIQLVPSPVAVVHTCVFACIFF